MNIIIYYYSYSLVRLLYLPLYTVIIIDMHYGTDRRREAVISGKFRCIRVANYLPVGWHRLSCHCIWCPLSLSSMVCSAMCNKVPTYRDMKETVVPIYAR